MHLSKPVVIGILLVSIAIAGFAAGSFAGAYVLGEPGSEYDPLVAESYLREAVEEATAGLKEEILALQVEIEILRNKLEGLEARATTSGSSASRSQSGKAGSSSSSSAKASGTSQPAPTGETVEQQIPAVPGKTGVVNSSSGANIRTGPGTDYDRVTTVAHQVRVEIVGNMLDWYEVKLADGTKGWIFAPLIDLD